MNSKGKGNSFERDIAEKLSLWLTDQKEKRAAWRSDTSGGAATVWSKKKQEERYVKANAGDIRQIMEKGVYPALDNFFDNFVVECKAYKEISLYPPFNKTLQSFFEACIKEKQITHKHPVLILKANNKKPLFCIEPSDIFKPKAKKLMTLFYEALSLDVYLLEDVLSSNEHDFSRDKPQEL